MEYPVNLRLSGRKCLVVGGGAVAERKIEGLLKAQALVTVIAPEVTGAIERLASEGRLEWCCREYRQGDASGSFLVFCATDREAVNEQAAADAHALGLLVNVADAPTLCSFTVPAQITRGELLLTVSTGGHSPAFTRRLREELALLYGDEYGYFLEIISRARGEVRRRLALSREREKFWRQTVDQDMIALLRAGKLKEAEERLYHAISRIGSES